MTKKPREYPFHNGSEEARRKALEGYYQQDLEEYRPESVFWWVAGVFGFYLLVFGPVVLKSLGYWPW